MPVRKSSAPPLPIEPLEARKLLTGVLASAGASSMAYDSTGALHVAFYDTSAANLKYARRAPDGTWSSPITLDAGPSVGSELSLAIDSAGRPAVAYYDAAHKDLKFIRRVRKSWVTTTIDARGSVGHNPALLFAPGDLPMISYYALTTQDLRLATQAGRKWRIVTIDSAGAVGRFSSIAINPSDGSWGIAYESADTHSIKFARRKGRGVALSLINAMNSAANWQSRPSLLFDDSGMPAISFIDPAGDDVILAKSGRRHWTATLAAADAHAGPDTTLSFDPQTGAPQVIYTDDAGDILLASVNGGTWSSAPIGSGASASAARDPITHALVVLDADQGDVAGVDASIDAPADLNVDAVSIAQVDLSWSDPTMGQSDFIIQRSTDGGSFATIGSTSAGQTSYSDSAVNEGISYAYRVCAEMGLNHSAYSDSITAHLPPAAPSNLSADASGFGVHLAWTDNSAAEAGINIERSLDGTTWGVIATLVGDVTAYTDTTALENTDYHYRISALTPFANGDPSDEAEITTGLWAPTNLTATIVSASKLTLTWDDHSSAGTGYEIWVSSDGVNWPWASYRLLPGTTSYDIIHLTNAADYWFRVRVTDDLGNHSSDDQVQTTLPAGTPGAAADDFAANISFDDPRWIDLNWSDDTAGETGWRIERADDGGEFNAIDILPANSMTYYDTMVSYDHSYAYRLIPESPSGDGAVSAIRSVTMSPAPPTIASAMAISPGPIDLTFNPASATTQYFKLMCVAGDFGEMQTLADHLDPATTTFSVMAESDGSPLDPTKAYSFWLEAVGVGGYNDGPVAMATTGFIAPTGGYATSNSPDHLDIYWSDVLGETGYELEISTDGHTYSPLATLGADVTQYTATGLNESTLYYIRIRANSAGGDTAWSQPAGNYTGLNEPTNITAIQLPDGTVQVTWDDNSNAETGYIVQLAQGNDWYSYPTEIPAGSTSHIFTQGPRGPFQSGRTYRFGIVANSDYNYTRIIDSNALTYT